MKKFLISLTSLLLVFVLLISCLPITAFAASPVKYETLRDNVPVWSEASSKSTKVRVVKYEETILEVVYSTVNNKGNKWYKLTDGNWIFSGNVEKHKCKGAMCSYGNFSYEYINEQQHKTTNRMDELCVCKAVVGQETSVYYEQHSFSNDVCRCGYKKPTAHVHWYGSNDVCSCGAKKPHTHFSAACGVEKTSYEQNNNSVHTVIKTTPILCSCGKEMSSQKKSYTEGHTFDVWGKCKQCDYKKHICSTTSVGKTSVSYEKSTGDKHITVTRKGDSHCSCGSITDKGTITLKSENHTFNNNKCSKCGYEKPVHTHESVACGKSNSQYSQKNASSHSVTTKTEFLCSCGEVLNYEVNTNDQAHTFNSNGVCTLCGYKKQHTCKSTLEANKTVSYGKSSPTSHIKYTKFETVLCDECKTVLTKEKTNETVEKHIFSDGKCGLCGYTEESAEHTHKSIKCGNSYYVYNQKDNKKHTKILKMPNLCSCGFAVSFSSIIDSEEKHNFKDNVCRDCGYTIGTNFLDLNAKQVVEQTVKGNYNDTVTLGGIVGEILLGEVPIVGTIADARDLVSDIQNDAGFVQTAIDAAAFIPVAGGIIKYADEAADAASSTNRIINKVSQVDDPYKSYTAFKKAHGPAGEGLEYHHIVEQSQIKKSGFASELINNGNNMIPLDKKTHRTISSYYSTKNPITGKTLREELMGKSFEEQTRIGLEILEIHGISVK